MNVPVADTKIWGRWATLGLAVAAALVAQIPALMACFWRYGPKLANWPDIANDGVAVALLVCISTPVQVAILALFGRLAGATATAYLGLTLPRRRDIALVIGAAAILVAVDAGSGWLRDQDIVTPFQRNIFRSASAAGIMPWLLLTTVVVAPIGEETLFRGFLFRGWHRSPRDVWAAIGATALLWAIIHVQYDPIALAQIFVFGLVLGWMRWTTGSTIATILLHGLLNGAAAFETMVTLQA
jgi:membrane protease YdiL (CAAX protease family)